MIWEASATFAPPSLAPKCPIRASSGSTRLITANGQEIGHYGEMVPFKKGMRDEVFGLKFQETDIKKPLLAVRRLVRCSGSEQIYGRRWMRVFTQTDRDGYEEFTKMWSSWVLTILKNRPCSEWTRRIPVMSAVNDN